MTPKKAVRILVAAAIYPILAWAGMQLGFGASGPTPIWPPSGYALALLVLGGLEMWPAVLLGALATTFIHLDRPITRAGFVITDTIEPFLGAWLLSFPRKFDPAFSHIKDGYRFVMRSVLLSTIVGATLGVLTLCLANVIRWENIGLPWFHWWISNFVSDMLFAPLIFIWYSLRHKKMIRSREDAASFALVASAWLIACVLIFFPQYPRPYVSMILLYLSYGILVGISIRWDLRASITAILVSFVMGIRGTYLGRGPFVVGTVDENLLSLQVACIAASIISIFLASAVAEQKKSLDEANKAVQLRDDFLSIASHELNTPLTSLQLQIQLLKNTVKKNDLNLSPVEKVSRLIEASELQITRFAELVKNLLNVSHMESSPFAVQAPDSVDLSDMVEKALDRYRADAEKARCEIKLRLQPSVLGNWEKSRIDQVIVNLLINAFKYGAGKPVEITTATDGKMAEMAVRDYGIGISKDHHSRIFDRFERAVASEEYSGIGLGLYISREIVQAHGGTIHVESDAGEGSTFIVRLPLNC